MKQKRIPARTSWAVWAIMVAGAGATLALMFVPPLLRGTAFEWLTPYVVTGWAPFCHQEAARSFHVAGTPLLACSRCTAIFAGGLAGVLMAPLLGLVGRTRFLPRWVLLVGVAPMAVDAGLGLVGIHDSTMISRTLTGALAGLASALFLVPGLIVSAQELGQALKQRISKSTQSNIEHMEVDSCHQE